MSEFASIPRLPPDVFNIRHELKLAARRPEEALVRMPPEDGDLPRTAA